MQVWKWRKTNQLKLITTLEKKSDIAVSIWIWYVNPSDLCKGLKAYRCSSLLHLWKNSSVSNFFLKAVKGLTTFLSHMMVVSQNATRYFSFPELYNNLENWTLTWQHSWDQKSCLETGNWGSQGLLPVNDVVPDIVTLLRQDVYQTVLEKK